VPERPKGAVCKIAGVAYGGSNPPPPTSPSETDQIPDKPALRGRLHQGAFFASIPAAIVLLAVARSPAALIAGALYGLSLIALFGTSAAYHRLRWGSERVRARMRRLDHAMIYVLIAGTYTPFSLLVLRRPWSIVLLSLVVSGAAVGILIQVAALDRLRVIGLSLYIVLGWLVILAAPQIVRSLHVGALIPLIVGGLLYTAGAVVLATRWPNPSPRVFGYHEVFHLATVVAAVCHYAAVFQVVLAFH
jgi:hemolysin III